MTRLNALDRVIAWASPAAGRQRARDRAALDVLMHYDAADLARRTDRIRAVHGDADGVAQGARTPLMLSARDMLRNSATAIRAQSVIVNNVIGTGIEPRLVCDDEGVIRDFRRIKDDLETVGADHDGVNTLTGMQRLAFSALVGDGEVLIVRPNTPGGKIRVLEIDYLDDRLQGPLGRDGSVVYDGIEYRADGTVAAYHLFDEHPGSPILGAGIRGFQSRRVDASRVVHLYRVDRPGQRRGVTWFAPVLNDIEALAGNDEAQMMRQRIAALFAVFWRSDASPEKAGIPTKLAPGLIQQIGSDDDVQFANPPEVTGYDDFARIHLRRIAAGLGITYEALTGDLSNVNFSSARLGRIEMGQNVEAWQWSLAIPRLCRPLGQWILRSWADREPNNRALWRALARARIDWTPPPPVIADPKTETQVAVSRIEAGLTSRRAEIRKSGYDPDAVDREIDADMDTRTRLSALNAPAVAAQADAVTTDQTERTMDA